MEWFFLNIFFLIFVCGHAFILIPPPFVKLINSSSSTGWLNKQKLILYLFSDETAFDQDAVIEKFNREFNFHNTSDNYYTPDLLISLEQLYNSQKLLKNDTIFTEFNPIHFEQLKLLFNIMTSAKTFDEFMRIASWSKRNINRELFVDSLYATILKRSDTKMLYLPPPYEVLPHSFVNEDVFNKIWLMISTHEIPDDSIHMNANEITIDMNYTGPFFENINDDKIAYFREDIGLNTYYYLNRLYLLNGYKENIGDYWYYITSQLNARYNLERISNGLGELEDMLWNQPLVGYNPKMYYSNMEQYQPREDNFEFSSNENLEKLKAMDSNLLQNPYKAMNRTEAMNNMWRVIFETYDSYDNIARQLIGASWETEKKIPSVIEHYATSLRDPAFWFLNKHLFNLYNVYLKALPPYTKTDLSYPGIKINNIELKKIQTYFDYFTMNMIEASEDTNDFIIKVGQPRLNYKPFAISINLTSAIVDRATIKIFIGPKSSNMGFVKYNSDLEKRKDNFFLIDSFHYNIKMGNNVISRKSTEFLGTPWYDSIRPDLYSTSVLQDKIQQSLNGLMPSLKENSVNFAGFPSRLVIPKGTTDGSPFDFFVIVAPFVQLNARYPFDKSIQDISYFSSPNMMFKEVVVYHKGDNKVMNYGGMGITKNWYPSEPFNQDEPKFDYNSKKKGIYKPNESYKNDFEYAASKKTQDANDNTEKNTEETVIGEDFYNALSNKFSIPITVNSIETNDKQIPLLRKSNSEKDLLFDINDLLKLSEEGKKQKTLGDENKIEKKDFKMKNKFDRVEKKYVSVSEENDQSSNWVESPSIDNVDDFFTGNEAKKTKKKNEKPSIIISKQEKGEKSINDSVDLPNIEENVGYLSTSGKNYKSEKITKTDKIDKNKIIKGPESEIYEKNVINKNNNSVFPAHPGKKQSFGIGEVQKNIEVTQNPKVVDIRKGGISRSVVIASDDAEKNDINLQQLYPGGQISFDMGGISKNIGGPQDSAIKKSINFGSEGAMMKKDISQNFIPRKQIVFDVGGMTKNIDVDPKPISFQMPTNDLEPSKPKKYSQLFDKLDEDVDETVKGALDKILDYIHKLKAGNTNDKYYADYRVYE